MLHQSEMGKRRQEVPTSQTAGETVTAVVTFDFPAAFTSADDLLEIAMLPAGNQLLSFELISTIAGATNATVALLDGEFGDTVDARALTADQIASGSVQAATLEATRSECLAIAKQPKNTGIGLSLSADVAQGGGTLTAVIQYAA